MDAKQFKEATANRIKMSVTAFLGIWKDECPSLGYERDDIAAVADSFIEGCDNNGDFDSILMDAREFKFESEKDFIEIGGHVETITMPDGKDIKMLVSLSPTMKNRIDSARIGNASVKIIGCCADVEQRSEAKAGDSGEPTDHPGQTTLDDMLASGEGAEGETVDSTPFKDYKLTMIDFGHKYGKAHIYTKVFDGAVCYVSTSIEFFNPAHKEGGPVSPASEQFESEEKAVAWAVAKLFDDIERIEIKHADKGKDAITKWWAGQAEKGAA
jgi:hypothetical protein